VAAEPVEGNVRPVGPVRDDQHEIAGPGTDGHRGGTGFLRCDVPLDR
jgi:hypothetical protein